MRTTKWMGPMTFIALALCGCNSVGPGTVARDRFDYSQSVSESWKRQTLLNIVKLRYTDPPIFVDVGQIVAGYTLETGVNVGGTFAQRPDSDNLTLGGHATYIDRPTVTYTPLTGNKFIKSLMMPLPPEAVFFTVQSGWPADGVLGVAVATINGLNNEQATLAGVTPADADFLRVLELLRKIQLSGATSMRVIQDAQKQQTTVLTFRNAGISQETLDQIAEVRRLLKLSPDAMEFKLVFAALPSSDRELAVITRSLTHIMATVAAYVDVPAEDIAQGRASPGAPCSSLSWTTMAPTWRRLVS